MSIVDAGTVGVNGTSGVGTTLTLTTTADINSATFDVGILVVVADNITTSDGATNDHTSVTGLAGTVTKLGEYTNGGLGAAGTGVAVSIWMLTPTGNNASGTVLTMNFVSAPGDRCCSGWKFTAPGLTFVKTPGVTNPISNEVAGAGYGSVAFSGLPSLQRLYFRGLGKEISSTTDLTVSSNFTKITLTRSRNNTSAVIVRGEFRINVSTGETSNPSQGIDSADTAGLFLALEEPPPVPLPHTIRQAVNRSASF